jgi:transposase
MPLAPIIRQLQTLNDEIAAIDRAIIGLAKTDGTARRLTSVPGIGPITPPRLLQASRMFASSRARGSSQRSSDWRRDRTRPGAKSALGACQKWGIVISEGCWSSAPTPSSSTEGPPHQDGLRTWAAKLMETKPFKRVAVATANKPARIAFALMRDGSIYGDVVAC